MFLRNYFREGSDGEKVKLPVKWMAPESLSDGHFSEKSDVVCIMKSPTFSSVPVLYVSMGHKEFKLKILNSG